MPFKVLLIDDEPGALEGLALWIDWERLVLALQEPRVTEWKA